MLLAPRFFAFKHDIFRRRHAEALRDRFVLTWVTVLPLKGTLLAQLFASAGPIFYDRVVSGSDPFSLARESFSQIQAQVPLSSHELQETLWEGHETLSLSALGISAFPSVHVALLVVCVLGTFRLSIAIGATLAGFLLISIVSTVFLGWHYLVDAYASCVVVWVVWWLYGRALRAEKLS